MPRKFLALLTVGLIVFGFGRHSAQAQSLAVSVPASVTAFPGQTVQLPVSVQCSGITGPVSIALAGLPSGITAAPLNLAACGSGNVPISLSPQAAAELWPNFQTPLNFIDSETATVQAVAVAGGVRASTPFNLIISINNSAFAPGAGSIDLPVIRISTPSAITAADTSGNLTVTSTSGAGILPGTASSDTTATFSIHGNSTALVPKLSYDVKLTTSTDLLAAMGVNCGYFNSSNVPTCDKSKTYVLLASFFDKTFLRHSIAMDLARSIRSGSPFLTSPSNTPTPTNNATIVPWAPHSIPVDVYLNGNYQGVYILMEKIKIDTHRVNIKEMSATDISGNALTGGYLMQTDYRTAQSDPSALVSNLGFLIRLVIPVVVEDPDPPGPEQKTYMQNDLSTAQTALFSSTFTDPNTGWRKYFDTTALVNYFIVNELMQNYDSGRMITSSFMFKDRNNGLIYLGPVWDFDVSSGNAFGSTSGIAGADATDPTNHYMQNASWWYSQLLQDPGFVQSVSQQWQALESSGTLESWFGRTDASATALATAAARDDQRWPKIGLPYFVSGTTFPSYAQETAYLQGWLRIRAAVMDQQFGVPRPASTVAVDLPAAASAEQPSTLTAHVVPADATGIVYFLQNGAILQSAPLQNGQAQISATLTAGPGTSVRAVYTGSSSYMPAVSPVGALSVNAARSSSTVMLQGVAPGAGGTLAVTAHVVGNTGSAAPSGAVTVTAAGVTSTGTLNGTGDATLTLTETQVCSQPLVARFLGDANFLPSTASQTIASLEPTTVTLTTQSGTVVVNQPFQVNAAASVCGNPGTGYSATLDVAGSPAGLALPTTAAVASGTGSFSGTATAPGTYTITLGADAPGVSAPALTVQAIAPVVPAITWTSTPTLYTNFLPLSVTATSDSPAPITYSIVSGPATLSGTTITLTGDTGTIVLQANQPAQGSYAAGQSTVSLQVLGLVSPGLAFLPPGTHTYGDAPFSIAASSQSTAPIAYSLLSGPATLSGATVQITSPGTLIVQAQQPAADHFAAASVQLAISVGPAQLYASADNLTRAYGAANPVFTGSLVGTVPGDTLTETFASTAVPLSAPASYAITPAAAGDNVGRYAVASHPGTLTVTRASVSLQISGGVASPVAGRSVQFTVSVTPQFLGIPTGNASLLIDGAAFSTAALVNGQATLSASFNPGQHLVSASYSGDADFVPSTSTAASPITVGAPDFTFSAASTQIVYAGTLTTVPLQLVPQTGTFYAPVTLSLSGDVPPGYQASLSPAQLPAGDGPATVQFVLTPAAKSSLSTPWKGLAVAASLLPLLAFTRRRLPAIALVLAAVLFGLNGCAGKSSAVSAPLSHTLTLTAQSGGVSHSVTLTLVQSE